MPSPRAVAVTVVELRDGASDSSQIMVTQGASHRRAAARAAETLSTHRGGAAQPEDAAALSAELSARRRHHAAELKAGRLEAQAGGAVAGAMASLVEQSLLEMAAYESTADSTAEHRHLQAILRRSAEVQALQTQFGQDLARAKIHVAWATALGQTKRDESSSTTIGTQAALRIPLHALRKLIQNAQDIGVSRNS